MNELLTDRERAIYNAGFNAGAASVLEQTTKSLQQFTDACVERMKVHKSALQVPAAPSAVQAGARLGEGIKAFFHRG